MPRPVGEGADKQVMVRSLAEQMVCEANAVLAARGERIELVDQAGGDRLCFILRYGDRRAELSTTFTGRQAEARLVCAGGVVPALPGECTDARRELACPDTVADLILALLSGRPSTIQQTHVEA
ncbi:hypothetical protein LWP59_38120 [Amycolatopsis acidiphila]|uniref:Uncharacterized protein n=1 Tax=Amycolatopsis acidiphila TaxID=715473 RepID=A0A558ABR7_9PSEU|nr:hypothetical protein [Amycolatopsis acidiphila]TVT21704.1 hypothetical protein FNH06_16235 [Amycolatopsis acidiphila]UIJ59757.1 hypothetical protein LWP59_38120 [Amycolatopsis acidiphila]